MRPRRGLWAWLVLVGIISADLSFEANSFGWKIALGILGGFLIVFSLLRLTAGEHR